MRINILGYDYLVWSSTCRELDHNAGRIDTMALEMKIAVDQHRQQRESTMVHEVIEAISAHLDLKLPHETISALETGLYQTLTGNGVDLSPWDVNREQGRGR
jgi:hypothetical protein